MVKSAAILAVACLCLISAVPAAALGATFIDP